MCSANMTACTGGCSTHYTNAHKKILACCLKDGRYDHYTDSWSNLEIVILERCISDFYGVNYVDTADFKNAMNNFRCYVDCTVINDAYYTESTKKNELINLENNLVNSCSRKLQPTCTIQTCNAPAYAANMCIRMKRGIYALANSGAEQNLATLSAQCIELASTMTGFFTTEFSNCFKNSELVYSTWDQCAYSQGDSKGYECFDEENECGKTKAQGSTG